MIFAFFFYLGGGWFSKILCNIWGRYVKILPYIIPYRGGRVVWERPKTPLRNIKMAPYDFSTRKIQGQNMCVQKIAFSKQNRANSSPLIFSHYFNPLCRMREEIVAHFFAKIRSQDFLHLEATLFCTTVHFHKCGKA